MCQKKSIMSTELPRSSTLVNICFLFIAIANMATLADNLNSAMYLLGATLSGLKHWMQRV